MSDLERKMVEGTPLETFKRNKLEISKAVTTLFPFLEMLRDHSLISEQMYHRAQKEYQKLVPMSKGYQCIYHILKELEKKFSTKVLEVLFHPINLEEYPALVQIQKHFKDGESASGANVGHPVQRGSLEKRASAVCSPQSSVQGSGKAKDPKMNFHLPELPVTCGAAKGTLHKKKMEKGSSEKCIEMADGTWVTLKEFEIKGGRELAKNWKKSIHCGGHTLQYLIEKKFLTYSPKTPGKRKKTLPEDETNRQPTAKISTPPCQAAPAQNAPPSEPQRSCFQKKKQGPGKTPSRVPVVSLADRPKYQAQLQARKWIHVTCGQSSERLFKNRFASLYKGKCILTARGWCTPQEFLATGPEIDMSKWTHNIRCGKLTLQTLIENNILKLHPDTCTCEICQDEDPFPEHDDESFMYEDEGDPCFCASCQSPPQGLPHPRCLFRD